MAEEKKDPVTDTDDAAYEQQKADAVAGSDRQIQSIRDWMDAEENRPETDEERRKRERQEKSKRIIAAVSDGLSSLSNLYFTSQYAPNMYNHEKGSMTEATDAHLQKLKEARDKKRDEYMQFALKLGDVENDRAKTLRELEAQHENMKMAKAREQREAESHGWQAAMQPHLQSQAEANSSIAQARAAAEPENIRLDQEQKRENIKHTQAQTKSATASAAASGRANQAEYKVYDDKGNVHWFRSPQSAEWNARQWGTWVEYDVTETTNVDRGRDSYSQTKTGKGGYSKKPSPTGSSKKKSPTA